MKQPHLIYKLFFFSILLYSLFISFEQICVAVATFTHIKVKARKASHKTVHSDKSIHPNSLNTSKNISALQSKGEVSKTPWSNAFNFSKSWGTQVNARTGSLMSNVKAGSLLSNFGHGPNIDLEVNYNSSSSADLDNIGRGWSWNLTHFNSATNQLSTSHGQNFYLQKNSAKQWKPLYHKLQDIQISGDKNTHFVITYPNGLREILSHEGYEIRLEQEDGRGVNFNYTKGTHLLQRITDDNGHQIKLIRENNFITVVSYGSKGAPIKVILDNSDGDLQNIQLPLSYNTRGPDIHINYMDNLITHISYPSGMQKKIIWNCTDDMVLPLQGSESKPLCVVSDDITDPGAGQPVMNMHYTYTHANANEHNYLARNSGLSFTANAKDDILFDAPGNYIYHTKEDNGITTSIHTYNKYHLMINVKQISDSTEQTLSEQHNFFCRTDITDGCAHTSFKDLPSTYSLPLKVVTSIWSNTLELPAITTETSTYDNMGRVTSLIDTYGRKTITTYCPVKGDATCPAVPDGWSLTTLMKSKTVYPSGNVKDAPLLLPGSVFYYYRKEMNIKGKGYTPILDHQIYHSGNHKIMTALHYYNNPANTFTYGLVKQNIITSNSALGLNKIIHDYNYVLRSDNFYKTVYQSIELGGGKFQQMPSVTTSIFTNNVLERIDPSGKNITRYQYDNGDHLEQIDMNVGTPFAASTHFYYTISPTLNQVIITAANGLQQKFLFDGEGRQLIKYKTAISAAENSEYGKWQPVSGIDYDEYGREVKNKKYLINNDTGKTDILTTTKVYGRFGRVVRVHSPDGETEVTTYNDANRCVISYKIDHQQIRSAVFVARANKLNLPIEQFILPASKTPLPDANTLCTTGDKQEGAEISIVTYDGFGRPVTLKDPMGRQIKKHYDTLGHVTDIVNPANNIIHLVYDLSGKIIERWALPASGGRYLLNSAAYNAANQLIWKAGEDGRRATFTYTTDGQLATTATPTGHIISWQYNVPGLPETQMVDGKTALVTVYDPVTLLPLNKTDNTGRVTYHYTADGLPQQVVHLGQSGFPNYKLQSKYDKNRRLISSTDIAGNQTLREYDIYGRIKQLSYHASDGTVSLLSKPTYDGFSRVIADFNGSGMLRETHYDNYGKQDDVDDTLNGELLSHWHFNYDANNNITLLRKMADHQQSGLLIYHYDIQDNLVSMTCSGSSGLPLCPRDTTYAHSDTNNAPVIIKQIYTFTPLNQPAQVRETLQDIQKYHELSKTIHYSYSNSIPLRLQKTGTQWNQETPIERTLSYDLQGNMTTDGQGNNITWNPFNQVTSVITSQGKQSNYFYDGSGKEVKESSTFSKSDLIYSGNHLIDEQISELGHGVHDIGYQGKAKILDGKINSWSEVNYKGDVTGVLVKDPVNKGYKLSYRNIYSPYGISWHKSAKTSPLYEKTLLGFDGERTAPATGWQFLGAGHRIYNPKMHCFISEDPAGGGYSFANNNPIMNTDPTGNFSVSKFPKKLMKAMQYIGVIGSFGLNAVKHHRKFHIVETFFNIIIGIPLTAFPLFGLNVAVGAIATAIMVGAGSLSAFSVLRPQNKRVMILNAILGTTLFIASMIYYRGNNILSLLDCAFLMHPKDFVGLDDWGGDIADDFFDQAESADDVIGESSAAKSNRSAIQYIHNNSEGLSLPSKSGFQPLWDTMRKVFYSRSLAFFKDEKPSSDVETDMNLSQAMLTSYPAENSESLRAEFESMYQRMTVFRKLIKYNGPIFVKKDFSPNFHPLFKDFVTAKLGVNPE